MNVTPARSSDGFEAATPDADGVIPNAAENGAVKGRLEGTAGAGVHWPA